MNPIHELTSLNQQQNDRKKKRTKETAFSDDLKMKLNTPETDIYGLESKLSKQL